jgi:hypothetical protein
MKSYPIISFITRNFSAFITFVAGVTFLIIRLAYPDFVSGNVADVLLLITLPMFILIFTVVYKLDEQRNLLRKYNEKVENRIKNVKRDLLETLSFRFRLFESKETCDSYYESMLKNSKIVKDLTWAEVNSQNFQISQDYMGHIQKKQEYNEIFIFSIDGKFRQDRLMKLNAVFEYIQRNPQNHINYSCAYYPESKFERLQYTIFDEKEVLFTSSYAQRCLIAETTVISILNKYFEQSWKDAHVLIENGVIIDEKAIRALLKEITLT